MNIRECLDTDIKQVIALWQACDLTRPWNDPGQDIALARKSPGSVLLLGALDGIIIASVLSGFDGHRGWLYYVAVHPDHQGKGHGRAIVKAGEDWLRQQGCPKVELIIRPENTRMQALYGALGYRLEPRSLMAKWLVEPAVPSTDMTTPRMLDVTITYLEMTEAPNRALTKPPVTILPLSLMRAHHPTVSFYRYMQHTIGDPWLWWERRAMSDARIATIIQDPAVEIYILSMGGVPAGFIELDFTSMPDLAEVAYFGLLPEYIGLGLGPYLLDWGIDCAWSRDPQPAKLTVNTCTLDHPKALRGYQLAGFEVVDRVEKQAPDPVAAGHIPKSVAIQSPGY